MFMYYVNDGVYGSFNCLLYDHAEVEPTLLHPEVKKHTFKHFVLEKCVWTGFLANCASKRTR